MTTCPICAIRIDHTARRTYSGTGGALGTALATMIMVMSTMALAVTDSPRWMVLALAAVAIGIGIGYSRLLEAAHRARLTGVCRGPCSTPKPLGPRPHNR